MARSVRRFRLFIAATLALGGGALSAPASSPSSDPFPAFKEQMTRLFRDCTYINLSVPGHQLVGVNPREEGRLQWEMLTREIEHAERGWAMIRSPQSVVICCETPENVSRMVEVLYVGGVVGPEGSPVSLKVGTQFGKGIDGLLAIGERREREWAEKPENPESWPVNSDQAQEIAAALLRAADIDPGSQTKCRGEPPKGRPGGIYTFEFPSIAKVTIDGSDGSIVSAVVLSPDTGPPGRAVSRDKAVAIGTKMAAALGLTTQNSSLAAAELISEKGTRQWRLTWRPAGSGARGSAEVYVDADTGRLLSAGESIPAIHAPVPPRVEPPSSLAAAAGPPKTTEPTVPVRISAEEALQIAATFAKAMDIPFGEGATVEFLDPEREYLTPSAWELRFYSFSTIRVDASTGRAIMFGDLSAAMAQRGTTAALTAEKAIELARPAAEALGLPSDAQLKEAHPGSEGTWSVRWGRVGPQGAFYEDDGLYVLVGPSGQVIAGNLRWSSRPPGNTEVKVTKERAEQVARDFARASGKLRSEPMIAAELRVVHPNGYWTEHPIRHIRYDSPTRLAWVVTLTQGQAAHGYEMIVWIDAADATILGGTQSSGMGPTSDEATQQPKPRAAPSSTIRLIAPLAGVVALAALLAGVMVWVRRRV